MCESWPNAGWPVRRKCCPNCPPRLGAPATALETAAEYADAGLWSDGTNFLGVAIGNQIPAQVSPLLYYYLAQFTEKLNEPAAASFIDNCHPVAAGLCVPFPGRSCRRARDALEHNPEDARPFITSAMPCLMVSPRMP